MSIPTAVSQLIEVEESRNTGILDPHKTLAISLSRVGAFTDDENGTGQQRIVAGTLDDLLNAEEEVFGEPLHSLIIVGKRLHHLEVEYAEEYTIDKERWRKVAADEYGCALD